MFEDTKGIKITVLFHQVYPTFADFCDPVQALMFYGFQRLVNNWLSNL